MFTDTEMAMAITHRRNVNAVVGDAQRVVDNKNAAIDEAHAEIRRLHVELATERAKRQAAELQATRLKALARSLA